MDHGEQRSSSHPRRHGQNHASAGGPPPIHPTAQAAAVRAGTSASTSLNTVGFGGNWKGVLEALRIRVALQELAEEAVNEETGQENPISVRWLRRSLEHVRTIPCSVLPSVSVTTAAVAGTFPSTGQEDP